MDQFTLKGNNNTYLIYRYIFEPVKSNMYVIINNNEALVFDPNENEELITLLRKNQIKNVSIILTHEHYDHTSGVNWLLTYYEAKIYCQAKCAKAIAVKRKNNPALIALVWADMDKRDGGDRYKIFKEHFKPYTIQADFTFDENVEWNISDITIKGISTPGHCPGSSFYWIDDNLVFTGDTILQNAPVILKFPESERSIYMSKTLPYIKSLTQSTILIPGHGDPFLLKDSNYL
ncbi:MBL fold metallo-hydrolase [Bacteroides sp.]|uniref:MBL fold metallo-hydrolase n=1 Tax=Bacteroides sp. TaxID=29523 RepID=UPI00261E89A8|nr:MBL fold metallo-hydrolase [Bacteroides sp.]